MSPNDRIAWEVQWHPASGARIRRLAIMPRGARRLVFLLGVLSWTVIAGFLLVGLDGFYTGFAVDSARRQNAALRAQQAILREQAFDLAARLAVDLERGRRMARPAGGPGRARGGLSLVLPASDAGNHAILAWLSEESARLEALGNELAARRVEMGGKQASVPSPVGKGTGPMLSAEVLPRANMGSARRQQAAPTTR